jgi:hypothetical protein
VILTAARRCVLGIYRVWEWKTMSLLVCSLGTQEVRDCGYEWREAHMGTNPSFNMSFRGHANSRREGSQPCNEHNMLIQLIHPHLPTSLS